MSVHAAWPGRDKLAQMRARESYLRERGYWGGPALTRLTALIRRQIRHVGRYRDGVAIAQCHEEPFWHLVRVGAIMEEDANLLKAMTSEVQESKAVLAALADEVLDTHTRVATLLQTQIQELRDSRMAVVREARDVLAALRDIRQFLSEAAYDTEMARLERLVALCRDLQALRATGVFDAVCETMLRGALREPKAPA